MRTIGFSLKPMHTLEVRRFEFGLDSLADKKEVEEREIKMDD